MKRTLTLVSEHLTELTAEDLEWVVGAATTGEQSVTGCPTLPLPNCGSRTC